jgi:hypothetical protein
MHFGRKNLALRYKSAFLAPGFSPGKEIEPSHIRGAVQIAAINDEDFE